MFQKLKRRIKDAGRNIVYEGIERYINNTGKEFLSERKVTEDITQIGQYSPDPQNTEFWTNYYKEAESAAERQFSRIIKPILDRHADINFEHTLDFACGFGRMANIFKKYSNSIVCCDINTVAISHCKERFSSKNSAGMDCNFEFAINDTSLTLPFDNENFTFIYSWDAMVHFKYKWLDYYVKEFYRVSKKGSYVFIHHSNYGNVSPDNEKSENWSDNPSARANVTYQDVKFIAEKHGFIVVEQNITPWASTDNMDCITLLHRPKN
jgi:ubiquinone/menaquinone biosynthesis C-methylase UbiE